MLLSGFLHHGSFPSKGGEGVGKHFNRKTTGGAHRDGPENGCAVLGRGKTMLACLPAAGGELCYKRAVTELGRFTAGPATSAGWSSPPSSPHAQPFALPSRATSSPPIPSVREIGRRRRHGLLDQHALVLLEELERLLVSRLQLRRWCGPRARRRAASCPPPQA